MVIPLSFELISVAKGLLDSSFSAAMDTNRINKIVEGADLLGNQASSINKQAEAVATQFLASSGSSSSLKHTALLLYYLSLLLFVQKKMPRDFPDGRHRPVTKEVTNQGYLQTVVEPHNNHGCEYVCIG